MQNNPEPQTEKKDLVVIKKYANRRLYNTETSTYVTLEDLAAMVRSDRDFVVYDAKTGDDLTHSVLTQIIVEQEARHGGPTLLPVPFLRQLIRFYGESVRSMVPSYLQMSLDTLAKEQERFRAQFAQAFGPAAAFGPHAFEAYQEQARKNLAMFEKAMAMWSPFGAALQQKNPDAPDGASAKSGGQDTGEVSERAELAELKQQLAAMQAQIDKLARERS